MRRFISGIAAAAALGGSLTFIGATQAVAGPEATESARAGCVKMLDRYNKRFNRYIKVKNTCGRKACFSVTVAARRDPEFSIGPNKTDEFRYGGIAWTKASGIKNIGC